MPGRAHHAARGVLEHAPARHGLTFGQQVTLRTLVAAGTPLTADDAVARVRGSLKAAPVDIRATLDALAARQSVLADDALLRPADAGRELLAAVGAETAPLAARIWGGTPDEDPAGAGRVLAPATERADAQLAELTA